MINLTGEDNGKSDPDGTNNDSVPRSPRGYDNTARSARAESNRRHIMMALAQLLSEKIASEVTFDQLAARAGLSVRTVFRFYKDKESLFAAFESEVLKILRAERDDVMHLQASEFAAEQYRIYERNCQWVEAMRRTPMRSAARAEFRQEGIEILSKKIRAEYPGADFDGHIAFIATLAGDSLWQDLRRYTGHDGHHMADVLKEMVENLVAQLEKASP